MKTTIKTILKVSLVVVTFAFTLNSCNEEDSANKPKVTTTNTTELTFNSAIMGGTILSNGGAKIIAKGICYGTTTLPTIDGDTTNQGEGNESFISNLTDLIPNTTYYARAYATNSAGTSYGEEFSFKTQDGLPTITFNLVNTYYKSIKTSYEVTSQGASTISYTGICFSPSNPIPTTMDAFWSNGTSETLVEKVIEQLEPGTKYYLRAFAYNAAGTGYSNVIEVTTKTIPTQVTDIDGNVYPTVLIGDQVWLASNLRVTKYNNGDVIGTTLNDVSGETEPKYQWVYNNDEANAAIYGRYYTYYAMTDSRKLCPTGTHISTTEDWGSLNSVINGGGYKLKSTGTTNWLSPNTSANNVTGFNGVGAGYRSLYGPFLNFKEYGFFSTTETIGGNEGNTFGYYLSYNDALLWGPSLPKKSGFSVRCVVD